MFHHLVRLIACIAVSSVLAEEYTIHEFHKHTLNREFWAEGADVGDFNNDGTNDIVSGPYWYQGPDYTKRFEYYPAREASVIKWAKNKTEVIRGYAGGLGNRNAYSENFMAYTGDFNKDGWDDIMVIGFPGKETFWYENSKGKGGLWKKHLTLAITDNESPQLANIVGGPEKELVCNSQGYFGYATPDPQDATKAWTFHRISKKGPWQRFTHGLGIGDINGDGLQDLIAREAWWEQPKILSDEPWTRHNFNFAPGGSAHMFAYDVDGDGDNDVLTCLAAHGFGLCYYEHIKVDGKITFKPHTFMNKEPHENKYGLKFSQPHAMSLVDMDGDGIKDLITGKRFWAHGPSGDPEPNAPAVLYWFRIVRNDDGVDFVPYLIDDDSGIGTQVEVKDVDGNGHPDIVVGNKKGVFVHLHTSKQVDKKTWEAAQPKPLK